MNFIGFRRLAFLGFCVAFSVSSVLAQALYSVNALAYADSSLSPGSNFITNPFNSAQNTVSNLFRSLPDGSYLRVWDPSLGGFGPTNSYAAASGWSAPDMTLLPPQGAVLWVPSPTQISFSGELFQGAITGRTYSAGTYVWGRIPAFGIIFCSSIDQCPPARPPDGTVFCKWNRAGQSCKNYTYFGSSFPEPGWYDEMFNKVDPVLEPGEAGVFYVPQSFSMPMASAPTTPAPVPAASITKPRHNGTNLTFEFNAPTGALFAVLHSTNLTDSIWQTVHEGTGTGSPATITLTPPTSAAAFYRVGTTNSSSAPYLFNDLRSQGKFHFRFYAPSNGTYEVQRSNMQSPPSWQTIKSISANAKSYVSVTDTNAILASAYYRVRLGP